ncbi:MAG TPA: hypothetical protein VFO40_26370 [Chthoniobacterales bacterium]|nr:hypothetical protein [Chthoniobacterales bacterium]
MIVVSTDVVVALYLPGESSNLAEAVLKRDSSWCSPMLWRTLFPHYLTQPLRSGQITPELVQLMLEEAKLLFLGREFPAPVEDNMGFVLNSNCSAFIAPFLALARGLKIPLVTFDAEAVRAFPEIAILAKDFVNAGSPMAARLRKPVRKKRK